MKVGKREGEFCPVGGKALLIPHPSPGSSTHTNICPESKYGRKQIKCKLESDKNIGVSVTRGTKILYTRKMGKKCLKKKKCPRPVSLTSITAPEMEGDIHSPPPGMGFLGSSTEATAHGLGTGAVTWSCWLQRYTRVPAAVPKDRGMHPLSWKGQMGLGRHLLLQHTHTSLEKKVFALPFKKIFCNQVEIYVLTNK